MYYQIIRLIDIYVTSEVSASLYKWKGVLGQLGEAEQYYLLRDVKKRYIDV